MERVTSPTAKQNQTRDAGVGEAHSTTGTDCGYSQRTDVVFSRATGNTLPIIPSSNPKGISLLASSGSSAPLAGFGSDPNIFIKLPPITVKPSPGPNPSTQYYVTEPSDSPKSPNPTQAHSYNNLIPPLPRLKDQTPDANPTTWNINPVPLSPPKPSSPKTFEVSLAQVFNSLNLKRKSSDEALEPNRSKILCLCSPNPNPKPTSPKAPRPTRKQAKGTRRFLGPNKGSSSVGDTEFVEDGAC